MASEQAFSAIIQRESIVFQGPQDDQLDFLQSLVTNDVTTATAEQLAYAALLTPQGKYLSDFFIRRSTDGDFILDVAPGQAEALTKRLTMYKLRRPISFKREKTPVAVVWGGEAPAKAFADPRDTDLGWRVYDEPESATESTQPGDYDLHRLKLAIPESEIDLISNDTYILEAGFERMNGVDFKKGCYVGQEIVARMKHKAELRKGYALVSVSGTTQLGETIETADGKPAGKIYSAREGVGLALLRFDKVKKSNSLMSGSAKIKIIENVTHS